MSQTKFICQPLRLLLAKAVFDETKYLCNFNNVFVRNYSTKSVKKKTASSVYRTLNIFDRKAKILQRERSAQKDDYHLCEYVKEEVGWRTADRIFDIKRTFKNAVELGECNSNYRIFVRNYSTKSVKKKTASSVYRTLNIFDRKAKILQRERSAQKDDYHLCEYVKEEVGWRTADRIFDIKRTFKNAVELGACRGYVSRHFLPDSVEKVTLCDTSQTHLDKALVGDGVKFEKRVMDEENIDLPDNSVDLLVSSLALHWVNDLPGVFDKIMQCLKPDGVFMACVFGGDTLMELRQALQLAEWERRGGVAPHVSPFAGVRDIGGLMGSAGFTLQTVDVDVVTVWYPSAFDVMRDVRALGEGNAALCRPLRLGRDVQFAAAAVYDEMYGKEFPERNSRGVPATYQIINFLGWKPDPSQPQPKERGTGELSLKDMHRIDEIITDTKKIKLSDEDLK